MTGRQYLSRYAVLALTAALAACGSAGDHGASVTARSPGAAATRDSAAGNVDAVPQAAAGDSTYGPPNHLGRIPVAEYHVIGDTESTYQRKRQTFRKDLEMLYSRGYRPITISQMLDKDFSLVPAGMSPVVFVFDD